MLDERDQLDKQVSIEALRWQSERVIWRRISPVCPLTCKAEAGVIDIPDQQGVDTCYSSYLQYLEALTSKRMEGVPDLHPSQMRFAVKCSSQWPSRRCWIDLSSRR